MLPRPIPRTFVLVVPLLLACQPEGCSCEWQRPLDDTSLPDGSPVRVAVEVPSGPHSGLVPLHVSLWDADADLVQLEFPGVWPIRGLPNQGLPNQGLESSWDGVTHTVYWDSSVQFPDTTWEGTVLVVATDPDGVRQARSEGFEVDNTSANEAPIVEVGVPYLDLPAPWPYRAEKVVVPLRLSDADSQPLSVMGHWSTDGKLWRSTGPGAPTTLYPATPGGEWVDWEWVLDSTVVEMTGPLWFRFWAYDGFETSQLVRTEAVQLRNGGVPQRAVRVTEIFAAPRSGVELQNGSLATVNLEGWTLEWTDAQGVHAEVLPAVQLARDERLLVLSGSDPVPEGAVSLGEPMEWENTSGSVAVLDADGLGTDFVRWGGSLREPPAGTSWVEDGAVDVPSGMVSLTRRDYLDTDHDYDWCLGRATPQLPERGCAVHGTGRRVWVSEVHPLHGVELWNASSTPVDPVNWRLVTDVGEEHALDLPVLDADARVWLPVSGGEGDGSDDAALWGPGGVPSPWGLGEPGALELRDAYGVGVDFVRWGGSSVAPQGVNDWRQDVGLGGPFSSEVSLRRMERVDTNRASDWCLREYPDADGLGDCLDEYSPGDLLLSEVHIGEHRTVEVRPPALTVLPLAGWSLHWSNTDGERGWAAFPNEALLHSTVPRLTLDDAEGPSVGTSVFHSSGLLPWSVDEGGSAALVDPYGNPVDFVRWGGSVEPAPVGLAYASDAVLPGIPLDTSLSRQTLSGASASSWCLAPPTLGASNAACFQAP